jgi:hypothetical protein
LFPHSGQNLLFAGMDLPHLEQVIAPSAGGVRFVPQLGQNLLVAGTFSPHLGQITSAAAGAA